MLAPRAAHYTAPAVDRQGSLTFTTDVTASAE
ncbi:DUF5707 domain-containing protein [Streptomyces sp. NPDC087903]